MEWDINGLGIPMKNNMNKETLFLVVITLLYNLFLLLYFKSFLLLILSILMCVIYIFYCYLSIKKVENEVYAFTESINKSFNELINKEYANIFSLNTMDETLIAKINQKMIRLAEILEHESVKGMKEKKELQVLISDISHQVKTPLTNLKMLQCTLLEKELPKEKRIELLLSVGRQLNKLDFLLNSMIKTSRLETGLIQLNKLEENLFETIAEALSGITILAEKKNMNILVKCSEEFLLKHDRKWTSEALFNVLENAVKYSPKGTVIEIQVSRWEISTKIDIIDQGKGIPEEHHGKIFQRFYREEYNNDEEGIGIGLYLTREIIQKQGGYIKVSSTVSKGSTFSIFLPNN